jgi:hypothetical protein
MQGVLNFANAPTSHHGRAPIASISQVRIADDDEHPTSGPPGKAHQPLRSLNLRVANDIEMPSVTTTPESGPQRSSATLKGQPFLQAFPLP